MKRRAMIALCVVTLVGCENMGLDYAGTSEEGRDRAPTDLVSAVHRAAPATRQPVIVDGRRWVPGGEPVSLDADELRSVGSSAGQTVYARRWDEAPFDMLFRSSEAEGQQTDDDTVTDAPSPGIAGSPGTAGARGTSATGPSGEAEWQPLVPVIGEDGGPAAQGEAGGPGEPAAH